MSRKQESKNVCRQNERNKYARYKEGEREHTITASRWKT